MSGLSDWAAFEAAIQRHQRAATAARLTQPTQDNLQERPVTNEELSNEMIPTAPEPAAPAAPAPEPAPAKPRRNARRPAEPPAAPQPPTVEGMVTLDEAQLSKLWGAITGGRIVVSVVDGAAYFGVSLDSFKRALPVLLERL